MKARPNWIDGSLYPFESKWMEIDNHSIHYVDEGQGPVLLFIHGTPEWSFGYRDLIRDLRSSFRCVAPDLLGFGLSDKDPNADYSCEGHHRRLKYFIEKLHLENIIIIANDFGAGISVPYAIDNPRNVQAIVLFNTWMWSLKDDPHYAAPARIMNSWLGRMLYLQFNFPVNMIMPAAYGNKKLLTSQVHSHYRNALPKGNRNAAYAFAGELINASDWWESYWKRLDTIADKPFLIFWGLKDKFVQPKDLEKWRTRLPKAKVIAYEDAGHFVQEEKGKEMVREIQRFIRETARIEY